MRLPPRLAAARVARMQGRWDELAAIDDALTAAADGTPRVVLASGEPGIGKTRLSAEAAGVAAQRGTAVLYGRCDDRSLVAHQPFAEALGGWVDTVGPAAARQRLADVADALGPLVPQLAGDARAGQGSGDGGRYVLFGAVARALGAVASPGALLILDDLHWADDGTLEMLGNVIASATRLPIAIVALYRPTELLGDDHPLVAFTATLGERPTTTTLDLAGLSAEQVAAVVAEYGGAGEDVGGLARWLRSETGGNPFLVRQLVRHLEERGRLGDAARGEWTPSAVLPGTVRDVTLGRVRRLGAPVAGLLGAAAVSGLRFDARVAADVAGLDDAAAQAALDTACRAGIVERDGDEHTFSHALFGHALREALPAAGRGRMHRRTAEAMEARGAGSAAQIAHQWVNAEPADPERTLAWARRAADDALAGLFPQEAVRWLGVARDLMEGRRDPADPERLDVLIALGDAQRASGDPVFRDTLLEASRLAHAAGDAERLVRAALHNSRGYISAGGQLDDERVALLEAALEALGPGGDRADRARLATLLAMERSFDGAWEARIRLADEALAIARRVEDPATLCNVLIMRHTAVWIPDTVDLRLAHATEALTLAEGLGDAYSQSRSLVWRAMALLELGELTAAEEAVGRAAVVADELGEPYARWQARIMVGNLAAARGSLDEAERHANAALEIGMASGQPDVLPFYANQIAAIRWDQGRLSELQPLVAQAVAANPGVPSFRPQLALSLCEAELDGEAREVLSGDTASGFAGFDYDVLWLGSMAIYAQVAAHVGDAGAAAALYERLEPWADQVVNIGGTAWDTVERALGRLASTLGRPDEAERRLTANVERCRAMGASVWEARGRLDLARVLIARAAPGDTDRARALLGEAAEAAARHGAAAVERRARGLLDSMTALSGLDAAAGRHGSSVSGRAATLRREGELWRIELDERILYVPGSRGLEHLALLVASPGLERPAVELDGDGRQSERARVNVTRALRRAIARIGEEDPALAVELDQAVRTGAVCSYDPPPSSAIVWTVKEDA